MSFSNKITARGLKLASWAMVILFGINTVLPPLSFAQVAFLPAVGTMVNLTPKFDPMMVKGIKFYPDNPFKFDFIVDTGDVLLSREQIKDQSQKLAAYFFASLTTPEKDMWVNLSPYENNRIIPPAFGDTQMGQELLVEDYMLKQIMATALYPEHQLGKEFWQKVYAQSSREFGTTNVPVSTFNKVWIVPDEAVVYENPKTNAVFVVKSSLKVMLEKDYLALQKNTVILSEARDLKTLKDSSAMPQNDVNALGSQIIHEVVIPALENEVNTGKNFAGLRQVYQSLILAAWYKKNLKDTLLANGYVDRNKTAGVDTTDKKITEKIYQQYLKAYRKGVYNYIREEADPVTGQIVPRKYFSGGVGMYEIDGKLTLATAEQIRRNAAMMGARAESGRMLSIGISVMSALLPVAMFFSPPVIPSLTNFANNMVLTHTSSAVTANIPYSVDIPPPSVVAVQPAEPEPVAAPVQTTVPENIPAAADAEQAPLRIELNSPSTMDQPVSTLVQPSPENQAVPSVAPVPVTPAPVTVNPAPVAEEQQPALVDQTKWENMPVVTATGVNIEKVHPGVIDAFKEAEFLSGKTFKILQGYADRPVGSTHNQGIALDIPLSPAGSKLDKDTESAFKKAGFEITTYTSEAHLVLKSGIPMVPSTPTQQPILAPPASKPMKLPANEKTSRSSALSPPEITGMAAFTPPSSEDLGVVPEPPVDPHHSPNLDFSDRLKVWINEVNEDIEKVFPGQDLQVMVSEGFTKTGHVSDSDHHIHRAFDAHLIQRGEDVTQSRPDVRTFVEADFAKKPGAWVEQEGRKVTSKGEVYGTGGKSFHVSDRNETVQYSSLRGVASSVLKYTINRAKLAFNRVKRVIRHKQDQAMAAQAWSNTAPFDKAQLGRMRIAVIALAFVAVYSSSAAAAKHTVSAGASDDEAAVQALNEHQYEELKAKNSSPPSVASVPSQTPLVAPASVTAPAIPVAPSVAPARAVTPAPVVTPVPAVPATPIVASVTPAVTSTQAVPAPIAPVAPVASAVAAISDIKPQAKASKPLTEAEITRELNLTNGKTKVDDNSAAEAGSAAPPPQAIPTPASSYQLSSLPPTQAAPAVPPSVPSTIELHPVVPAPTVPVAPAPVVQPASTSIHRAISVDKLLAMAPGLPLGFSIEKVNTGDYFDTTAPWGKDLSSLPPSRPLNAPTDGMSIPELLKWPVPPAAKNHSPNFNVEPIVIEKYWELVKAAQKRFPGIKLSVTSGRRPWELEKKLNPHATDHDPHLADMNGLGNALDLQPNIDRKYWPEIVLSAEEIGFWVEPLKKSKDHIHIDSKYFLTNVYEKSIVYTDHTKDVVEPKPKPIVKHEKLAVNHAMITAVDGGIDLGRLILNSQGPGGVRTAFNNPRILQMLLNAKGLFPEVESIEPMTAPMVKMLLGI